MPAYKDKKRGTWYCKFNYRNYSGETKQKLKRGFATRKAALEYERDFLSKKQENRDITIKALCESYLEYSRPRIRESTFLSKTCYINNYIVSALGNRTASELTIADVVQWQNDLLNCERLSDTTKHHINGLLSSVFNYGIKFLGLVFNPAREAGPIGTLKSHEGNYWTYQEYKQFRKAIKSIQDLAIFDTLFYTGARIGEVLALKWLDINFDKRLISINKTLTITEDGYKIGPPKTHSSYRSIDIPAALLDVLQDYRNFTEAYEENDFLFGILPKAVRDRMRRYIKTAGVTSIRLHDIRHSHASLLITNGVDVMTVSKRLGHTNTSTTLNLYAHAFEQNKRQIADILDAL